MDERARLMMQMLASVRSFFERVRDELGGAAGAHPRQAPVLGLLLAKGEMSQAEVARALKVTAATVAVSAARLEKLGYVARHANAHDRRSNVIGLTEAGRAEARRVTDALLAVSREATRDFTDEERETLARLCRRMDENLRGRNRAGEESGSVCTKCCDI